MDFGGLRYPPFGSPAGKKSCSLAVPADQFCFRPGNDFEVLWYAVDMSLTVKTSHSVELPINSVSGWEHELEFCTIQQFSLRPRTDLVVLCDILILLPAWKLLRPTSTLTSRQRISQRRAKNQLLFRLGTYFGAQQCPPVPSGWAQTKKGLASHQLSFKPEMAFGVQRNQPFGSPAGKRSCSVALPTNFFSGQERTLKCQAIHEISLRLGTDLVVSR